MAVHDAVSWDYPGARWWKFDFHTHTPASNDYQDPEVTPEAWLLGFMRAEIDCVAVTDHNSGAWVDRLKSALSDLEEQQHPDFRALHLFPGAEVTANGNTHVLAILDPNKATEDIDTLLGAAGYHGERGESKRAADASVIEVVAAIVQAGGVAIPAHVDQPSGLWSLSGNSLEPVLTSGHVFAVEVTELTSPRPDLHKQHSGTWAEVLGSDSHRPAGLAAQRQPGSHFTWVKMEEPTIDGLRLALLDGKRFSIHRSDDSEPHSPAPLPDLHIRSIEIEKARHMGHGTPVKLEFSPWFNVLIGGRGTGKSTVLHCLRLAARRESDLRRLDDHSNARSTFERFNQVPRNRNDEGGLREDTRINWTLNRGGTAHRVNWWARPQEETVVVEDQSGSSEWVTSTAQNVTEDRFPLRLFSQGQIAELAGDNQASLLELIDEGAQTGADKRTIEEAQHDYMNTRARIRDIDRQLTRLDEVRVGLADNQKRLADFEDSGRAQIFHAFRRGARQQRELDRHFGLAGETAQRIRYLAGEVHPEDIIEDVFDAADIEETETIAVIGEIQKAIQGASGKLLEVAQELLDLVERQRSLLADSSWQRTINSVQADHQKIAEQREEGDLDNPAQHELLVQERQRLMDEEGKLHSLQEERQRLVERSSVELSELAKARRKLSEARARFLEETLAENEFVRIRLIPYGENPRAAELSLRKVLNAEDDRFSTDIGGLESTSQDGGIVESLLADLPGECPSRQEELENRLNYQRARFTEACSGKSVFGGYFTNFLKKQFDNSPEYLDRLLIWFPPDSLQVEHRLAGTGSEFRPIGQGSAGQRAAAMLAFLLAYGEDPLVLDQPEDDLDNQLIYSLIVRQIRENKLRRQIIAVTHNPNIVVNGDAEMVHVLGFGSGQCQVLHSHSLQHPEVRDQVCLVMEGGREALERRYQRLDAGSSDV